MVIYKITNLKNQNVYIGQTNNFDARMRNNKSCAFNPKAYLELQQEFYDNIREKNLSPKLCHYVWDVLISMNRGYGFNALLWRTQA